MRAAAPLRAAAARLAPQPACAGMTAAASAPPPPPPRRLSVAVVGAGAAGLAAARELLREGHAVTVFEQGAGVGGQWRFSDNCEADDLLGRAPARRVPGSVYASLRTNLPREVMGYLDMPLDARFPGAADPARFCSHGEVLRYLEAYAARFDLLRHCRLATAVRRAEPAPADGGAARWRVATAPADAPAEQEPRVEFFDALVAANGHFSVPRLPPPYPGVDAFPGLLMHAHNYRRPQPFVGKSVVLVGAAFSGSDIAQELLDAGAARVTLSARDWGDFAPGAVAGELRRAPDVAALRADGGVEFVDGSVAADVDALIFCTGYEYTFDFLEGTRAALEVDDNRVVGVFKDVWPLLGAGAPPLALIGLPWRVAPFPQMQLQARWVARLLAGRFALPPADKMAADVARQYAAMEAANVPKRYTHRQGGDVQRAYNEFLVAACRDPGEPDWPLWRSELHSAVGASRRAHGAPFRDRPIFGGDEWLAAAAAEFAALHAAADAAQ